MKQPSTTDSITDNKDIVRASLAGQWYSANPTELREELEGYLADAGAPTVSNVIALIAPHAGYAYSGPTAAYGMKQVEGKTFSRVIVMGPSHRVPMRNAISVPSEGVYRTPLGDLPIDTSFIGNLREHAFVVDDPRTRMGENSVEMQIPLLQTALGTFPIVPIVVGQLDEDTMRRIGRALRELIDDRTLIVCSSDFTHFGRHYGYVPFTKDIAHNLAELDGGAVRAIEAKDLPGFLAYCARTGITLCGRDPIGILLAMLPPESEPRLLHYETSAQRTGDFSASVSYVSLAFSGSWDASVLTPTHEPVARETALNEEDKRQLLKLARQAIAFRLDHGRRPTLDDLEVDVTPHMQQVMGAFVTLHKDGALRGCIGEIEPRRPLVEAVLDQAQNAAFRDPRFRPLGADELNAVDIEISALTPPVPVASWRDIVIGRHGMTLEKDGRAAVFLPQVAPEQGWGIEETLTHLAMKAGLRPDAWKGDASFTVFEAIVFHEP